MLALLTLLTLLPVGLLSGSWTTATLSTPRHAVAATSLGHLAFFAGGVIKQSAYSTTTSDVVDIYDASSNTWSVNHLSQPRGNIAAISLDPVVIFAGGGTESDPLTIVDIFDITTAKWNVSTLRYPVMLSSRHPILPVKAGSYVLISGYWGINVYDSVDRSWSYRSASVYYSSATSVGNFALFFGGCTVDTGRLTVDVFDASTRSWSQEILPTYGARCGGGATSAEQYAFYAGGTSSGSASSEINIFDSLTKTWTRSRFTGSGSIYVSLGVQNFALFNVAMYRYNVNTSTWSHSYQGWHDEIFSATAMDNLGFFAGGCEGYPNNPHYSRMCSDAVDMFNATSDSWTAFKLSIPRCGPAATAVAGVYLVAGGKITCELNSENSNVVDIYDTRPPRETPLQAPIPIPTSNMPNSSYNITAPIADDSQHQKLVWILPIVGVVIVVVIAVVITMVCIRRSRRRKRGNYRIKLAEERTQLLKVPKKELVTKLSIVDTKYHKIVRMFKNSWIKGDLSEWKITNIAKLRTPALKTKFKAYCAALIVPNVVSVWHGTSSLCGFPERQIFTCRDSACAACNISQKGFLFKYIRKNTFQRFGRGFYFGYHSSKSADYPLTASKVRTLILCKVAAGRECELQCDNQNLMQPPLGYDSVKGVKGKVLNYPELVVYNEGAILPCYIVTFTRNK